METQSLSAISNPDVRHDFVMVFDVTDGNPNGDPDNGGEPRQDPIDMRGIVSPGCIKRRIRDSLALLFNESLYIASGTALDAPQLAAIADAEKVNGYCMTLANTILNGRRGLMRSPLEPRRLTIRVMLRQVHLGQLSS